jgi:hypothetical protein
LLSGCKRISPKTETTVQQAFASALTRQWPNGDGKSQELIAGTIASVPAVFAKYSLNTALWICRAMAQFSEGCGALAEYQDHARAA